MKFTQFGKYAFQPFPSFFVAALILGGQIREETSTFLKPIEQVIAHTEKNAPQGCYQRHLVVWFGHGSKEIEQVPQFL
jgi:hypothetical protein